MCKPSWSGLRPLSPHEALELIVPRSRVTTAAPAPRLPDGRWLEVFSSDPLFLCSCGPPLVFSPPPTAPEWVHPLRARQPAPRAAQRSHNVPVSHRPTLTVTVVSAVALALELSLSIGLPHPVHHLVSACPATQLRPQANDLDNTQHWPVKSPHNPTQHRSKDKPRTRGIGHSVPTVDQTEDSRIRDNRHYHR